VHAKTELQTIFVPEKALQGEDVPSFLTWKGAQPAKIIIETPDSLTFKEAYNVSEGGLTAEKRTVIASGFEIDGYLGLLFRSSSLEDVIKDDTFNFSLIGPNGELLAQTSKKIRMYRPLLRVEHVPNTIVVDVDHQAVKGGIKIKNAGRGTVVVLAKVAPDSPVTLAAPDYLVDFKQKFERTLNERFAVLRTDFPTYAGLVDEISTWMHAPPDFSDPKDVELAKKLGEKFEVVEDKFAEAFSQAIIDAIITNIQIETVYQQLLQYIKSIGSERIILGQPLNVIRFVTPNAKFKLKLVPRNLVFNTYESLELPEITIQATKAGEIPLYKLFEWS
jgi:hypothetical protein